MGDVRGLSMEPRGIGMTKLFQAQGFSLETLRRIVSRPIDSTKPPKPTKDGSSVLLKGVARYPCNVYRSLLPIYGILASGQPPIEYDKDMNAANVEPW
jgi:hypothetical protein